MENKILALIPSRAGSKRLPRKNMLPLAGKPLISYTLDAALNSSFPMRIMVSTDDHEVIDHSLRRGVEVPFIRPDELAKDDTKTIDVVIHALDWLRINEQYSPDYVLLLQPTSPLRTSSHIDQSIELIMEHEVDSVISVTEVKQSPYWMMDVDEGGFARSFIKEQQKNIRRKSLTASYVLNGAIYLSKSNFILHSNQLYCAEPLTIVMASDESVDIDTNLDFRLAELLIEARSR